MNPTMLLGLALQFILQYREAREKQAALKPTTGVPDDPTTLEREDFLSDPELIALLKGDSRALRARADGLIAKYRPM